MLCQLHHEVQRERFDGGEARLQHLRKRGVLCTKAVLLLGVGMYVGELRVRVLDLKHCTLWVPYCGFRDCSSMGEEGEGRGVRTKGTITRGNGGIT